ncbi:MAG: hypothetical protein AB7E48_00390 [Deferribacterales bacterium]
MENKDSSDCSKKPTADSPSFIAYLEFIQQNIVRMSTYSSQCRMLCVLIVGAIIALSNDSVQANLKLPLCLVVIVLLGVQNALYAALRKDYTAKYDKAVTAMLDGKFDDRTLFNLKPDMSYKKVSSILDNFFTWSVAPLYFILTGVALVVTYFQ